MSIPTVAVSDQSEVVALGRRLVRWLYIAAIVVSAFGVYGYINPGNYLVVERLLGSAPLLALIVGVLVAGAWVVKWRWGLESQVVQKMSIWGVMALLFLPFGYWGLAGVPAEARRVVSPDGDLEAVATVRKDIFGEEYTLSVQTKQGLKSRSTVFACYTTDVPPTLEVDNLGWVGARTLRIQEAGDGGEAHTITIDERGNPDRVVEASWSCPMF